MQWQHCTRSHPAHDTAQHRLETRHAVAGRTETHPWSDPPGITSGGNAGTLPPASRRAPATGQRAAQ